MNSMSGFWDSSDSSFEGIFKDKQGKEGDRFRLKNLNLNYLLILIFTERLWIMKIKCYNFPEVSHK